MNKYLSLLFTVTLASVGTLLILKKPVKAAEITFFCKDNRGVFSAFAKNINGDLQPVFHFKSRAFNPDTNLSKLCTNTTNKLNEYFLQNNYPSSLRIIPTDFSGLPAICITEEFIDCNLVLFLIDNPESNSHKKSYQVLSVIIDERFRHSWIKNAKKTASAMQIVLFE